jgi:hypothetical protein
MRKIHDQSTSKHSEIRRICKYISKWYYWSQVKQSIKQYIRNCHICKRFKATRDKYSKLLNLLFILDRSWTNIIMNFVIDLSKSKNEFNVILMIINRLTKMHHYISCVAEKNETTAEKTTRSWISYVWKLHELSNIIISDRNSQFVSLIWKTVCKILKINAKLSIAFHSETDEQSEIVNQEMKRYFRSYCNYQQDDWSEWLFMTEFAFNVVISISTELFAFIINYEFESRMFFDSFTKINDESAKERILTRKTSNIMNKMKDVWNFIKRKLTNAQKNQNDTSIKKEYSHLNTKLKTWYDCSLKISK